MRCTIIYNKLRLTVGQVVEHNMYDMALCTLANCATMVCNSNVLRNRTQPMVEDGPFFFPLFLIFLIFGWVKALRENDGDGPSRTTFTMTTLTSDNRRRLRVPFCCCFFLTFTNAITGSLTYQMFI